MRKALTLILAAALASCSPKGGTVVSIDINPGTYPLITNIQGRTRTCLDGQWNALVDIYVTVISRFINIYQGSGMPW